MAKTLTPTESEFLSFAQYVITEAGGISAKLTARGQKELGIELLSLASIAGQKKREILGLPEPDPTVCYDDDCHADGTPILPGEPRREKGESFADGLDLAALKQVND
jgi:hypothetical protein